MVGRAGLFAVFKRVDGAAAVGMIGCPFRFFTLGEGRNGFFSVGTRCRLFGQNAVGIQAESLPAVNEIIGFFADLAFAVAGYGKLRAVFPVFRHLFDRKVGKIVGDGGNAFFACGFVRFRLHSEKFSQFIIRHARILLLLYKNIVTVFLSKVNFFSQKRARKFFRALGKTCLRPYSSSPTYMPTARAALT